MSIEAYMEAAMMEGRKALPRCLPNPPVGAVLVRSGVIIGRGHTQPPGLFHAEVMAISASNGSLEDAELFVTLEPCSFHGRTPSCAQTLVELGIRTIHVAMVDPDPRNNGKGLQILRSGGVRVLLGALEHRVRTELGPYLNLAANAGKTRDLLAAERSSDDCS